MPFHTAGTRPAPPAEGSKLDCYSLNGKAKGCKVTTARPDELDLGA
jgi:hypothetical protein